MVVNDITRNKTVKDLFMYNKNDKLTAFNTFCNLFGTNTKDNEFILYQLLYR